MSVLTLTRNAWTTSPIQLDTLGTLDWFWFGDLNGSFPPWLIAPAQIDRKRQAPGWLWRGFRRMTTASGAQSASSARTMTANQNDNNAHVTVSSTSFSGWFQLSGTSIYGTGWQFTVPASRAHTRRLMVWSSDWRSNLSASARLVDGDGTTEAVQSVVTTGINGRSYQEFVCDFRSDNYDTMLILECYIASAFTATDQGIAVHGSALTEAA